MCGFEDLADNVLSQHLGRDSNPNCLFAMGVGYGNSTCGGAVI